MNCRLHPTKAAVTRCSKCGAGVCEDCARITASTGDYCVKCAYQETVEDIEFDEELKASFKKRNIVLLILWIVGLPMIIAGAVIIAKTNNFIGLMLLLGGFLISGIPTAIQFWKRGTRVQEEFDDKFGATYHVSESGVYKDQGIWPRMIWAIIGLFIGVLMLPKIIAQNASCIREINEELDEIIPIKNQLAQYYNKSVKNRQ